MEQKTRYLGFCWHGFLDGISIYFETLFCLITDGIFHVLSITVSKNILDILFLDVLTFYLFVFGGEPSPTRVFLEEYNGFSTFTFFETFVFS